MNFLEVGYFLHTMDIHNGYFIKLGFTVHTIRNLGFGRSVLYMEFFNCNYLLYICFLKTNVLLYRGFIKSVIKLLIIVYHSFSCFMPVWSSISLYLGLKVLPWYLFIFSLFDCVGTFTLIRQILNKEKARGRQSKDIQWYLS